MFYPPVVEFVRKQKKIDEYVDIFECANRMNKQLYSIAWTSSIAVRALAHCAEDHSLGPTWSQWLNARSLSTWQRMGPGWNNGETKAVKKRPGHPTSQRFWARTSVLPNKHLPQLTVLIWNLPIHLHKSWNPHHEYKPNSQIQHGYVFDSVYKIFNQNIVAIYKTNTI